MKIKEKLILIWVHFMLAILFPEPPNFHLPALSTKFLLPFQSIPLIIIPTILILIIIEFN